ncbi:MAG: hypothetical protein WA191_23375, partial [Telluria sp.]
MEQAQALQDDANVTIELPSEPAANEPLPPVAARGRVKFEMRAIHEAIARVEAEGKASCAAESRAIAEARARSLAEECTALDIAAAEAALKNAQASEQAIEASRARLEFERAAAQANVE